MTIMVDTDLYDDRGVRLICTVCPGKVVSEFIAASIVLHNIANLRRVLINLKSAKYPDSFQRVLDCSLNELRMSGGKSKLLPSRSRFFYTP